MTPDDVATVQATLPDLGPRTDELARAFYARLFALDPTLRPLFPTDMEAQRQKFVATLGEIVAAISRLDRFTAAAGALGVAHVAHGAEVRHYAARGRGPRLGPPHDPGRRLDPGHRPRLGRRLQPRRRDHDGRRRAGRALPSC